MSSLGDERDEALSKLAHDLKTPLTAINGFAELLQARDDEHTRREATARILEASGRLSAAIDRLLGAIAETDLVEVLAEAAGKRE